MDYQKIYDSIINKAKSLNRKKGDGNYYERHHIIPRCMGGSYESENLVLLTAKEHYVCHKLLHYLYPDVIDLARAFRTMTHLNRDKRKIKLTLREYEEVRKLSYILSLGENNPMYNKKHKPETIKKLSEGRIGVKRSDNCKKKQSETNKKNGLKPPIRYKKDTPNNELKKRSERMSGKNNIMYGISLSGERNPMFGRTKEKSPHFGKKQNSEHINKRITNRLETVKRNKELIEQEKRIMIF